MSDKTQVRNFSFGAIELRNQYRLKAAFASKSFNRNKLPTIVGGVCIDFSIDGNGVTVPAGKPIFYFDYAPSMDWIVYQFSKTSISGRIGSYAVNVPLGIQLDVSGTGLTPKDYVGFKMEAYVVNGVVELPFIDIGDANFVYLDCSDLKVLLDGIPSTDDYTGMFRFLDVHNHLLFNDFVLKINEVSVYAPLKTVKGLDVNYIDDKAIQFLLRPTVDFSLFELQPSSIALDNSAIDDYTSGKCGYLLEKIGGQ